MLVFRCLQGIGAALVLSCGAALVTSLYGEERRSRALGIYTMMLAFGLMLGPLLGGALTAIWDWPAVFWFRIPIAIAALLLLRGLPVSPPRQASDRFDVLGGIALALGLVTMLMTLNRFASSPPSGSDCCPPWPLRPLSSASPRAARPIIAVDVLRLPGFALLNLVSVLANLAAFSVWLLVPYYLARVPGYSPDRERRHPGRRRGGRRAGRADRRPPRRAAHFRRSGWRSQAPPPLAPAFCMLGTWTEQTPTILRIAGLVVQGIGLGLFQLAYSDIVTAALPLRDRGVAGSLVLLTRTLGTVTAASVVLMVFEILKRSTASLKPSSRPFSLQPCWHLPLRDYWRFHRARPR